MRPFIIEQNAKYSEAIGNLTDIMPELKKFINKFEALQKKTPTFEIKTTYLMEAQKFETFVEEKIHPIYKKFLAIQTAIDTKITESKENQTSIDPDHYKQIAQLATSSATAASDLGNYFLKTNSYVIRSYLDNPLMDTLKEKHPNLATWVTAKACKEHPAFQLNATSPAAPTVTL